MIIWKGMGIGILLIVGLFYWLTGYIFEEAFKGSKLHVGVALIIAGGFWVLTMWRKKTGEAKILAGDDEEKIKKYKEAMGSNPMMQLENSSLFFIPVVYWQYILWAGGVTAIVFHFAQGGTLT